jgi:hypothetical protein
VTTRPFADGAAAWRSAGWLGTLPLPAGAKSEPPKGYTGRDAGFPIDSEVDQWAAEKAHGNLAVRLPRGVVGLDVDDYGDKHGAQSLARLEEAYGPLPPTYTSTSRPAPSGIRLYRVPFDFEGHGVPRLDGRKVEAIEVIQFKHRYLCAWPSIHPEGRPYVLVSPGGEVLAAPMRAEDLTELPAAWVAGLSVGQPKPKLTTARPAAPTTGDTGAADRALGKYIAELHSGSARHDAATEGAMALGRLASLGYPGADANIDALHNAFLAAVSGDGSRTTAGAEAEWKRIVDSAEDSLSREAPRIPPYEPRRMRPPPSAFRGANALHVATEPTEALHAVPDADDDHQADEMAPAPLNLPAEFWEARPVFDHIRRAAHARCCSADALLHAVLARISALTTHKLTLPPLVGPPGSLNYCTAITGESGTGKSAAMGLAGELLVDFANIGRPGAILEGDGAGEVMLCLPLSTGEGVAEAYMGEIEVENDDGEPVKVRGQAKHNALFVMDEGEALFNQASRQGATLMETLRRAWSGSVLGQANATEARRRIIPAGNYRFALIIGFQPIRAGYLLADAVGGTPQRFSWASATDPALPDEPCAWPGLINWQSPPLNALRDAGRAVTGGERFEFEVDPAIRSQIWAERVAIGRGEVVVDELDAHANLCRLKIAALLSLLDFWRFDITPDDWDLAGIVWDTSCAVRASCLAAVAAEKAREEEAAMRLHSERETVGEMARQSAGGKIAKLAMSLAWFAHDCPGEILTRRDLGRRIAGRDRKLWQDDAIAHAVAEG